MNKYNGGKLTFNTGINTSCKKNSDCKHAFNDLSDFEKVKCNKNTGICERYMLVNKHIK